jgi:hypothetical protein
MMIVDSLVSTEWESLEGRNGSVDGEVDAMKSGLVLFSEQIAWPCQDS